MLTVLSTCCLLIRKILTLVVRLGFEKKAFEMSSFQSPLQEVRHYVKRFPLICIYLLGKFTFYINSSDTSQETSFCFNFTDFKILIFFLRITVVSHLNLTNYVSSLCPFRELLNYILFW